MKTKVCSNNLMKNYLLLFLISLSSSITEKVKYTSNLAENLKTLKKVPSLYMMELKQGTYPLNQPVGLVDQSQNNVYMSVDENKYYFKFNIKCGDINCRPPLGYCINPTACNCIAGYAIDPNEIQNNERQFCTYSQKKQIAAFLLELIIPIGVGHFYSARILHGVLKLVVVLCYLMLNFLADRVEFLKMFSIRKRPENSPIDFYIVFTYIYAIAILIFILIDLIFFATNSYRDGNGIPLLRW